MENKILTVILVQLQALKTRFQASQSHHFDSWQAQSKTGQDYELSLSLSISPFLQKIKIKMDNVNAPATEEMKV